MTIDPNRKLSQTNQILILNLTYDLRMKVKQRSHKIKFTKGADNSLNMEEYNVQLNIVQWVHFLNNALHIQDSEALN